LIYGFLGVLTLIGLLIFVLVLLVFIKGLHKPSTGPEGNPGEPKRDQMPKQPQKPLLVTLQPRAPGFRDNATSWLGGAPALGGIPWPRNSDGAPLSFIAQFSLSDIAASFRNTVLPTSGSLAFFIGPESKYHHGRVLYVPAGITTPTPPPGELPQLGSGTGIGDQTLTNGVKPEDVPSLLPHWPVDFIPLDAEDPDDLTSLNKAMDERFGAPSLNWFAYKELTAQRGSDGLHFWDTAWRFAQSVQNTYDAAAQANDEIYDYVQKVATWAFATPQWQTMGREDIAQLEAFFGDVVITSLAR